MKANATRETEGTAMTANSVDERRSGAALFKYLTGVWMYTLTLVFAAVVVVVVIIQALLFLFADGSDESGLFSGAGVPLRILMVVVGAAMVTDLRTMVTFGWTRREFAGPAAAFIAAFTTLVVAAAIALGLVEMGVHLLIGWEYALSVPELVAGAVLSWPLLVLWALTGFVVSLAAHDWRLLVGSMVGMAVLLIVSEVAQGDQAVLFTGLIAELGLPTFLGVTVPAVAAVAVAGTFGWRMLLDYRVLPEH